MLLLSACGCLCTCHHDRYCIPTEESLDIGEEEWFSFKAVKDKQYRIYTVLPDTADGLLDSALALYGPALSVPSDTSIPIGKTYS